MVKEIVHWLVMPCSKATLSMEKKNAGEISSAENLRLKAHLKVCKWCRAYNQKLHFVDQSLKNMLHHQSSYEIKPTEIQDFKEQLKEKLKI